MVTWNLLGFQDAAEPFVHFAFLFLMEKKFHFEKTQFISYDNKPHQKSWKKSFVIAVFSNKILFFRLFQ